MGAFFIGLFGSIAGFFAQWLTKKTAAGLAAITTFGVLTVGIYAALSSALASAVGSMSVGALPSGFVFGVVYFMPDNLIFCLGLCVSGRVSVSAYRWNVENLRLVTLGG